MLEGLSREAHFILSCLSASDVKHSVTENLKWDSISLLAKNHGITSILHQSLSSSNLPIPAEVLDNLRLQAARISARNAVFTRELLRILKLFQENNISAIAYKGPVLSHRLYGNIALRDFDDLDVLIYKKDILAAKKLLLHAGYRPKEKLTNSQERALLGFYHTYDFIRNQPNHQLEVHWGIVPKAFSLPLDYGGIWNRRVRISLEKTDFVVFSPEDLLFILCITGAWKLWDRLLRVMDVAKTLSIYPGIDWDQVTRCARDARAERILLLSLSLASTLFEARLPVNMKASIEKDPAVASLTKSIVDRMFSLKRDSGIILPEDQFQPFRLQMREHFVDRVRYILRVLLTPSLGEWAIVPLPGSLYFLYHLMRPVRLCWKTATRLPQLLLRRVNQ